MARRLKTSKRRRKVRRRLTKKGRRYRGGTFYDYTMDTLKGVPLPSTAVVASPTYTQSYRDYKEELDQYQSSGYPDTD